MFPSEEILALLKSTTTPILHIAGDHDIIFPVENWYALNQQLPTLQLLTFPRAGHGPQHQHPEASAEHIATFVRTRNLARRGEATHRAAREAAGRHRHARVRGTSGARA